MLCKLYYELILWPSDNYWLETSLSLNLFLRCFDPILFTLKTYAKSLYELSGGFAGSLIVLIDCEELTCSPFLVRVGCLGFMSFGLSLPRDTSLVNVGGF